MTYTVIFCMADGQQIVFSDLTQEKYNSITQDLYNSGSSTGGYVLIGETENGGNRLISGTMIQRSQIVRVNVTSNSQGAPVKK